MGRRQRERGRGASLVEFAFVGILLFTLLFGIIGFGVLLSFKQTMTQAANEAARRAAVSTAPTNADKLTAARDAVTDFEAWGRDCLAAGMDCSDITVHDCGSNVDTPAQPDCVTVHLHYDYGAHPIVPQLPFVGAFMPDSLDSSATAQITFPR